MQLLSFAKSEVDMYPKTGGAVSSEGDKWRRIPYGVVHFFLAACGRFTLLGILYGDVVFLSPPLCVSYREIYEV